MGGAVVRCFACYGHIVRMAFKDAGVGDAGKFGVVEGIDVLCTAVAHSGPESAQHLVHYLIEQSLVWHACGYAFGHKLFASVSEAWK